MKNLVRNIRAEPAQYGIGFIVAGDIYFRASNATPSASFGGGYPYPTFREAATAARIMRRFMAYGRVALPNLCGHWSKWGRS